MERARSGGGRIHRNGRRPRGAARRSAGGSRRPACSRRIRIRKWAQFNQYMAIATVSRISPAALVAALLTVAALAGGCATGKEEQVRKIQARNAYDQAGSNLREGRISLGLAALQEAVELDPDNAMYRNALGVTHLQLRRWPEAQAQFEKAIQLDPNYAEAYHNLGLVMAAQNRLDQAVASYRRALTFPTYPSPELAYHNLGEAYLRQGKVKE